MRASDAPHVAIAASPVSVPELAPGDRIGRYVAQARVGTGAMGIVYTAFDPELDRMIAVKLLNPEIAMLGESRMRLKREAKAMARLSNPHVVAVHDVGEVGDQIFIAMEYIDGTTLRGWLHEKARSWRETLAAVLDAGRGLAAAHEAGLVHRDFKLDNVLVGRGGRICVTDFGLARHAQTAEIAGPRPSREGDRTPFSLEKTETGTFLGTPVYMASEVLAGQTADALSDQFSFCVTLYEALYGERPFVAANVAQLAEQIRLGRIRRAPEGASVPSWVRRLILRGLRADRAARHPSMTVLLRALGRDPRVALRRWIGVALLAAIGTMFFVWQSRSPASLCKGADKRLAGVWDDGRRAAIRTTFAKIGKAFAVDSAARVERLLDSYSRDWVTMNAEACEATRVTGTQSDELLSMRMDCLDRRLDELKAVTDLFARADSTIVANARTAASSLTPLDACKDRVALSARVRPPEERGIRAKVEEVRRELARVNALDDAGKFSDGLRLVERVSSTAQDLPYRPVVAEALYWRGLLESHAGRARPAEKTLLDAVSVAEASHHDELAARAWIELLDVLRILRPTDSKLSEELATAAVERVGSPAAVHAELLDRVGSLDIARGAYAEAASVYREALTLADREPNTSSRLSPRILGDLAIALDHLGQHAEQLTALRRAVSLNELSLGPSHPLLAEPVESLANALADRGEYAAAETLYRRALELREKGLEPNDPRIAETLADLALLYHDEHRPAEALPLLQRSLKINERAFGPEHLDVAAVLDDLGLVQSQLKELPQAKASFERVIAIREKTLGPGHPLLEKPLEHLARTISELGDDAGALAIYRQALDVGEKTLGPNNPELSFSLFGIGRSYLRLDQPRRAIPFYERTCKLRENGPPRWLAECRLHLAIALAKAHTDLDRARALAKKARVVFMLDPGNNKAELSEVDAWLVKNR
jgi:tetratricopeptide (TPR) repeat protein/predicted Ser/Thr protein kinase